MQAINRLYNIFLFWSITSSINFIRNGLPLRFKLFKKRLPMFLLTCLVGILLIKHCDYIYLEFAYGKEINKYPAYKEIWQTDAHWYKKFVEHGHNTLVTMLIAYQIYFVISSFWLSLYGFVGKYKEDIGITLALFFLITNNWYTYGYMFYTCQANVMLLACFLYNAFYWVFHLILWDEEMDAYYENQVDLANKGREKFVHQGDDATPKSVLQKAQEREEYYTDENRPDLVETMGVFKEETFAEWEKNQGMSNIIDDKSLQLKGEYVEDSVVEAIWDLEARYQRHVAMFYHDEDRLSKRGNGYINYDEEMNWEMVNYLLIFPIRYWQSIHYWRYINKYDIFRVRLLAVYHMFRTGQFTYPKVVGPYSIFSPYFKANVEKLVDWQRYQYLLFLKVFFLKVLKFFSIKHRYQNWRWVKFTRRFSVQLTRLKKKNSINYTFFKKQITNE